MVRYKFISKEINDLCTEVDFFESIINSNGVGLRVKAMAHLSLASLKQEVNEAFDEALATDTYASYKPDFAYDATPYATYIEDCYIV